MHFRVQFLFEDRNVNNEIDFSIWKHLPAGMTRMGIFFGSGDTWFETDMDYSIDDLSQTLQKALDDVFAQYKKRQDMFGYVAAGYKQYLVKKDGLFKLSEFTPHPLAANRVKVLKEDIKRTEDTLYRMKKELGELFREIDHTIFGPHTTPQFYRKQFDLPWSLERHPVGQRNPPQPCLSTSTSTAENACNAKHCSPQQNL